MKIDQVLHRIKGLPEEWHKAGTVPITVLEAIARHLNNRTILHSMETGSGKTTLLFSHISLDHKVFSVDAGNSISVVRNSPLFNQATVEFIEGPTQLTLPSYTFTNKLQMAFIDGPHGYPFPEMEYFRIYPQLEEDSLLIIDDIQIPTTHHLFDFLKEDDMFSLIDVVENTAFFVRTNAPTFAPTEDGWWLQNYNKKRFPVDLINSEYGAVPQATAKIKSRARAEDNLALLSQQHQELSHRYQELSRQYQAAVRILVELRKTRIYKFVQHLRQWKWIENAILAHEYFNSEVKK